MMVRRLLVPSLADLFFVSVVVLLYLVSTGGWTTLLADGDTGWHIRTGEYILEHRALPQGDPFSFTKPGEPWYAWEWLSDVAFASMHRRLGLKGVVWLAGITIAVSLTVLFRQLLWRGTDTYFALAACLLAAGASMVHYLARPHVFTLLLLAISLFLLDRDRRRPGRWIWVLAPLAALWANLHGGFLALLATLAVMAAATAIEAALTPEARPKLFRRLRRELALAAACTLATAANPYGIGLHRHIVSYLGSNWIRSAVQEFESPRFRSENMAQFEILLIAGVMSAAALVARREWTGALLTLFWAHAALGSVRHVPLYALAAAPWWAGEASARWQAWTARRSRASVWRLIQEAGRDFAAQGRRTTLWPVVFALLLLLPGAPGLWPRDFPQARFPVELINRQAARLRGARVFTSDQWADYLLYRFYPGQRVFLDGRSDFYGPELGKLYLRTTGGEPGAGETLEKYEIGLVLAPPDWALVGVLKQSGRWRVVDEAEGAVLLAAPRPAQAAQWLSSPPAEDSTARVPPKCRLASMK